MFGNHDYETAKKIALEKSKELGEECVVLPADEDGKFTIGRPLKAISGAELIARITGKK